MRAGRALVLLVAGALAAPSAYAAWRSAGRVVSLDEAPARDVAMVLGAEVYPSGLPSRYLRARLDVGAELVRRGLVRVLLVSGADDAEHHHETTAMRRYLEARGVPAGSIVEDTAGLDTYDSCVRARRVFGVTSLLVVSQAYHLPRAVATCRAVGVDAVGVADVSVRPESSHWTYGSLREYGANVKMAWDLLSRREPRLEPTSDAVRRASAS